MLLYLDRGTTCFLLNRLNRQEYTRKPVVLVAYFLESMADLDELLDELTAELDDNLHPQTPVPHLPASLKSTTTIPKRIPNSSLTKKCSPVFLSGSMTAVGLGSHGSPRSCDKLICLACDCRVVSFDNYQWTEDVDYLFLRNNYPDFSRLQCNMRPRRGSRAYACQCQHQNAVETRKIGTNVVSSSLKWTCMSHPSS